VTTNRRFVEVFTLQLEVLVDGEWMPVVRCDTAHGEAHVDHLRPDGVTYRKEWLGERFPYNDVFTATLDQLVRDAVEH